MDSAAIIGIFDHPGFGVVITGSLLAVIIAIMEEGQFPDWRILGGCVLAYWIPSLAFTLMFEFPFSLLGVVAGAVIGGFTIAFLTGMSVARATCASVIFVICLASYNAVISLGASVD